MVIASTTAWSSLATSARHYLLHRRGAARPERSIARACPNVTTPAHAERGNRGGHVPNVVYRRGDFIGGRELMLPYEIADDHAAFGTVNLDNPLSAMNLGRPPAPPVVLRQMLVTTAQGGIGLGG